jgi:hypothetical protein
MGASQGCRQLTCTTTFLIQTTVMSTTQTTSTLETPTLTMPTLLAISLAPVLVAHALQVHSALEYLPSPGNVNQIVARVNPSSEPKLPEPRKAKETQKEASQTEPTFTTCDGAL